MVFTFRYTYSPNQLVFYLVFYTHLESCTKVNQLHIKSHAVARTTGCHDIASQSSLSRLPDTMPFSWLCLRASKLRTTTSLVVLKVSFIIMVHKELLAGDLWLDGVSFTVYRILHAVIRPFWRNLFLHCSYQILLLDPSLCHVEQL